MEQRLLDQRRRALQKLPPIEEILRGTVLVRELRCGKPTCHCASGERHRVTYLTVTLAGGRTEQISLPATVAPLAQCWVANYRKWWDAVERISAINRQLLRRRRDTGAQARATPHRKRQKRRTKGESSDVLGSGPET